MVRSHETTLGTDLLRLIRQRGEANLGQTLIDLAQQAAAEHRAQTDEPTPCAAARDDQAAPLRRLMQQASEQTGAPTAPADLTDEEDPR